MRLLGWVVAIILVGGVALGLTDRSSGSVDSKPVDRREVLFTYRARLTQLPPHAKTVNVWIPLAKTTGQQQIFLRQVHAPVPYAIAQDPLYGNDILHLTVQRPLPEDFEVSIDYYARLGLGEDLAAHLSTSADEPAGHLEPHGLVIIDDEVRARAARATAGCATPMDKARGIYEAVIHQVAYDKSVPGWGRGDTRRVCLIGKGNCTDFHSLFISMARASQIPSRFKIGVLIPQGASGMIPGYHCWAEFYEQGQGWVPVDASEAWKHPELADYYFGARDGNRLLISVGRDIQLVPRQRGEPVNIFFYPHVEVDGRKFDGVQTEFRFRELQPGRKA